MSGWVSTAAEFRWVGGWLGGWVVYLNRVMIASMAAGGRGVGGWVVEARCQVLMSCMD